MIIPTLTSDPAVALELGRRLAKSAARRPSRFRIAEYWKPLKQAFARSPRKWAPSAA